MKKYTLNVQVFHSSIKS